MILQAFKALAKPIIASIISCLLTAQAQSQCSSTQDLVSIALEHAPSLEIQQARLDAATATAAELNSSKYPQIRSFVRSGVGDGALQSAQVDNEVGLQLSYRLYDFGKSRNGYEAARAEAEAAKFYGAAAIVGTQQRVLSALDQLVRIQEILSITEARITDLEARVTLSDRELELGATTRLDTSRLASDLALARLEQVDLSGQYNVALAQLEQLTQVKVKPCLDAGELLDVLMTYEPDSLDGLVAGIDQSGALRSAEKRLTAARARKEQTRKDRLPAIELSAFLSQSYDDTRNRFEQRDRVGVQLSMPLLDGGILRQRNLRQSAEERAARAEFDSLKLEQSVDASAAWQRYLSLKSSMTFLEDAIESASEYTDATLAAYDLGASTVDDLLEAQEREDNLHIQYANSNSERRALLIQFAEYQDVSGQLSD